MAREKIIFFGFLAISIIFLYNVPLNSPEIVYVPIPPPEGSEYYDANSNYLVSSSKCKLSNLNPFNTDAIKFLKPQKYHACTKHGLLTFTSVVDNIGILHFNKTAAASYSKNNISCCFSYVTRKTSKSDPDLKIKVSQCTKFYKNATLTTSNTIKVNCKDTITGKSVYENAHVVITINENLQKKINKFTNETKPISIFFIGIDSISRLNFIRSMPETYKYVEDNNNWLPLHGYNKIADNTFPNLMAIFTGLNSSRQYNVCKPKSTGFLDKCPIIFYDYRKLGYVTVYAEDEATISTFNYKKKGFTEPPTDFYFRPYVIATEELHKQKLDDMDYCTGPESAGERILNIAKDASITFRDTPYFGFYWMNSFSHNKINSPSRMDLKVKQFFQQLQQNTTVMENSIIVFLSDHGMRFGDIRLTYTGWIEERLPFIYVWFPNWFSERFPKEHINFKQNKNKLTSPYDLHMTLQHLLILSGYNRSIVPSEACPKCKSLFEEIEQERSCEDVGISQHWCTCAGYKTINLPKVQQEKLANFVIRQIEAIIRNSSDSQCAKYSVSYVISVSAAEHLEYKKNVNYILIKFETFPKAIFETTISYDGDISRERYHLTSDISRLDLYAPHSYCTKDAVLKKYCYCR